MMSYPVMLAVMLPEKMTLSLGESVSGHIHTYDWPTTGRMTMSLGKGVRKRVPVG